VSNINPTKDLYSNLGLSSGATVTDVDAAFIQKSKELAASTSPDAKIQLAAATYAHRVLANTQTKTRYDTSQIEPTVFATTMGHTLYIYISKMSPTTLAEFADSIDNATSTPGLDSMIIDMRGNIGGSLADAASLLGYFVGSNQYAFDLYSQTVYNVIRTSAPQNPALLRYRELAVLTDSMTQSTAEVLTASLKRFHLARVVGATTRGWGTVENTFPLLTTIPDTGSWSGSGCKNLRSRLEITTYNVFYLAEHHRGTQKRGRSEAYTVKRPYVAPVVHSLAQSVFMMHK
jgi:C-terminal processing protease CtpA/Prc